MADDDKKAPPVRLVCDSCGEVLASEAGLRIHKRQKHPTLATSREPSSDQDASGSGDQDASGSGNQDAADTLATDIRRLNTDPETARKHFDELMESLTEVEVQLADKQADKNSPLYSAKTFADLNLSPELLKGVYAMNFNRPSKIQEKALPLLAMVDEQLKKPRDLIAQSQSGTGKTAAFALAMLQRVSIDPSKTKAICVAPSRELARQIGDVITRMAQFTTIRVCFAVKDENSLAVPRVNEQIIVGTPGTVLRYMSWRGAMEVADVRMLVIDEAELILESREMVDQVMKISKMLPALCQRAMFSATYKDRVKALAEAALQKPNLLTLKKEELTVEGIKQFCLDVPSRDDRFSMVMQLYAIMTIGSSVIFCNRVADAQRLYVALMDNGYTVSLLHGQLDAISRDKVMDDFRKGATKVLISTNVIARGIDVLQISLVVNFDLPVLYNEDPEAKMGPRQADFETYLHRIGRTGRFGRTGSAINFVYDNESRRLLGSIEQHFGKRIEPLPSDEEQLEQILATITRSS